MKNVSIKTTAGLLSVWFLLGAPAFALQLNNLPDRERSVKNFDAVNLGPVLTELGLTWQTATLENGQTILAARTSSGFNMVMKPSACFDNKISNCVGLQTLALFDGPQPSLQALSNFNENFPFTTAGPLDKGYYLSRYDIADYGIPRGNIESSLKNFTYGADIFREQMSKDRFTASFDPEAGNEALSTLHMSSDDVLMNNTNNQADLIEILLKDPYIDNDKITNIVGD